SASVGEVNGLAIEQGSIVEDAFPEDVWSIWSLLVLKLRTSFDFNDPHVLPATFLGNQPQICPVRRFEQNAVRLDGGHLGVIVTDAADSAPEVLKEFLIVFQTERNRCNCKTLTVLSRLLGLRALVLFVVMGEIVTAPKE